MSAPSLRLAGPSKGAHRALRQRRMQDLTVTAAAGVVALVVALAITVAVPSPKPSLVLGLILGVIGVVALMGSTRYEVSLTIIVLYLGMLDGPIKLLTANQAAAAGRDVLIFAVVIGMAVRAAVSKQRVTIPALGGWAVAFVAIVVIEAFNPGTASLTKVLGGFRQQLEWVPFFFFGYMLMRSKDRFRKLFLVFGVIALANGAVGVYQSRLSPTALGAWGPGYNSRINGTGGVSGRTYSVEGVARPRPPALGSDSGFGGGVGVLALPGLLALLSIGNMRRKWIAILCSAGALAGIATAASRTSLVIGVIALLSYAGLSIFSGLKIARPLLGMLVVIALGAGVASVLVATDGKGIFKRQESVTSVSQAESSGANTKTEHLNQLPTDISAAPFGVGLATGGSAGGFGGKQHVQIEGKGATAEGALNLLVLETGLPGLLIWLGLSGNVLWLAARWLRRVRDVELRTYLVAIVAVFLAYTASGFAGPTLATAPAGTFLWFASGVIAYWLAGPGRRRIQTRTVEASG